MERAGWRALGEDTPADPILTQSGSLGGWHETSALARADEFFTIDTWPATGHIVRMKRFWDKVLKSDGCWEWQAAVTWRGYGVFRFHGKQRGAHSVAFELENGPVPPGLCVCHHCDNPRCVRPDHLFLGTHVDNSRDYRRKHGSGRTDRPAPTPKAAAVRTAREILDLSQAGLARALRLGRHGERTVRRWELGDIAVPGPVQVAIEAMLRDAERDTPTEKEPHR